jgi:hypothetical protein
MQMLNCQLRKYTSQYMMSEGVIQKLCNMTRCILKQSRLPKVFQSEALHYAVSLLECSKKD